MVKYALLIEYDGSRYHGWQIQNDVASIQGDLEHALSSFADHKVNTITAGRTDAGVHALNQVVHFISPSKRGLNGWVIGVNAKLPSQIRVKQAVIVDDAFDARFSALSRKYEYYLLIGKVKPAILEPYVGYYYRELDLELMQTAANYLLGKRDFSAFRSVQCQAATAVREIMQLNLERRGAILRVQITANAFLQHMVRNIVGALIYVGCGKINYTEFVRIVDLQQRTNAPPTFMPNGLYLSKVTYTEDLFNSSVKDNWLFNI